MQNIALSVCLYSGNSQTVYDVKTGIPAENSYNELGTSYIAGIRNKNQKIIAAIVFISSIADKNDPRLADVTYRLFELLTPTKNLVKEIYSLPVSRLKLNLNNGSVEQAFSEDEINMLFTDFFIQNSIEGSA